ncbi:hypothetical protein GCM10010911_31990 [Paenibacillus nasutitermitis]|uniref:DUF4177 domain-containing protein n=1 Tax=Paenibacillus nasutitermitis TaxID=1652958 RepID=A0A916Z1N7_9BACL|nr:hypothetical protein GCM10010911_31990 [Paenibacillus nasutitermitis]
MPAVEHILLTCEFAHKWFVDEKHLADCDGKDLIDVLNYLGQEGWEFAGRLGHQRYVLLKR